MKVKTLPYPHKFFSLFARMRVSPPIDIFLGRGTYIFENFRNWNVLFSKSITYIHDVSFKIYPEFVQEQNLKYLNKNIQTWLRRTDRVVTVSESSRDEITRELEVANVGVVQNAVDATLFYPRKEGEVAKIQKKWNLPNNYFVFIGNIEPRKNLKNTIVAFKEYEKTHNKGDALILIGGGGWKNEEILKQIDEAQIAGVRIIRPDGYVPDEDLPAIISGAKALLQFSWHEGFGLPVLQALACGTPVAASDIPPLHEVARGNDDRVVFSSPRDVERLASAIDEAGKIPHVQEPKNIRTWDESVKDLLGIIDSL
jgi:glycosyltransferase involved in cell wall biosynthesis